MSEASRGQARRAASPLELAAWIVALLVLTVVTSTNQTLADNRFFFVSHNASPWLLVGLWIGGIAVLLLAVTGLMSVLRRLVSQRTYDRTATALTFLAAFVLLTSALTWWLALPAAGLFAWAARRIVLGKSLLVIATVVAMFPLASASAQSVNPYAERAVSVDPEQERPNILWVIPDSVQYPLLFDEKGDVRPQFPNLRKLQRTSTTYTRTFTTANVTAAAVPSMLNGVAVVTGEPDQWNAMTASPGVASWLTTAYDVTVESEVFPELCSSGSCATYDATSGSQVDDLLLLGADIAAVAGRSLNPVLAEQFPPLENRWRDFWAADAERGGGEPIESRLADPLTRADSPQFVLWHHEGTHEPFDSDFEGRQTYKWDPSLGDGTLGVNDDSSSPTAAATRLPRRLYAADTIEFDRRLGTLLDRLAARGAADDMMIVVTSDHGRSFPRRHHARVGDSAQERWSEVAHVPLLVKQPGQSEPDVVSDTRTTAQIARTVLDAAGVQVTSGPPMPPGLDDDPDQTPHLWIDLRDGPSVTEPMPEGVPVPVVWNSTELDPASPEAPLALVDDDLSLGRPLDGEWANYEPREVSVNSGDSSQQLLLIEADRGDCTDPGRVAITVEESLVGQVEWDETNLAPRNGARGWAIVPKLPVADYSFWCQPV